MRNLAKALERRMPRLNFWLEKMYQTLQKVLDCFGKSNAETGLSGGEILVNCPGEYEEPLKKGGTPDYAYSRSPLDLEVLIRPFLFGNCWMLNSCSSYVCFPLVR